MKPLNPKYLCLPICLSNQYRNFTDYGCYNCSEFCAQCTDSKNCEICEQN